MYELSNPAVVKSLLDKHGASFTKSLGQNFIINPSVCPKMAEMSGISKDVCVIEIGPGIGVLTAELAKRAKKVVCIELDTKLLPILDDTLSDFDNVRVINQDILKTDIAAIIRDDFGGGKTVVCANLPYYITSPVIMYLLESRLSISNITVMVQKEVAQRLCAEPGSKDAGAVSYAVNYFSKPSMLFSVSAGSFIPSPHVDSEVIRLDVREKPAVQVNDEALMFKIIKAAFEQRRKTLLNALSAGFSLSKDEISQVISAAGLPPAIRGERLSLQNFAAIANIMSEKGIS